MRRGNAGLTGCCGGFGILGIHISCPNPQPAEHTEPENDPGGGPASGFVQVRTDTGGGNAFWSNLTSRGFAFAGKDWTGLYGTVHKEIRPELWPPDGAGEYTWNAYAAFLPAAYPGVKCEKYPPISSADKAAGGTGEFQADLGVIMAAENYSVDSTLTALDIPRGYAFFYRSRFIYTDGMQSDFIISKTGRLPETLEVDGLNNHFNLPNPPRARGHIVGDTFLVSIAAPASPDHYNTDNLDGIIYGTDGGAHASAMEIHYASMSMNDLFDGATSEIKQFPCFQTSHGKRYAVLTSYNPTDFAMGGASGWQVVRLKYVGTRQDDDNNTVTGVVEVFSTFANAFSHTADLGKSGTTYAGDYIVIMPSQRCYLDSSVDSDEIPDEPHVAVINKDFSSTKIIAEVKWHSKIFRPGEGDETDFSGIADGTVSSGEAAAGTVIMDATDPPDDYPDETFPNPELWCYNRQWDSVLKQNVPLALLTTRPDDPPDAVTSGVIADFEDGVGGHDPNYLDHGLPDGVSYDVTSDVDGNGFIADNIGLIGDTGSTVYEGSYSAQSQINVQFESDTSISVTINVATEGDFEFKFRFDNRIADGVRDGSLPFTSLTNFPNVDNTFGVYLDGTLATIDNFKIDGTPASGLITNSTFIRESDYLTWYTGTLHLLPGTHTIRRTVHRGDAEDVLILQLDHEAYPDIMPSDDIDSKTRWAFMFGKLVKLSKDWVWAARDEENNEPLSSRAKTVPHYIAMDGAGRVLIGNPHGVVRYNRDGTIDRTHGNVRGPGFDKNDKGFRRFTASPNIERPPDSCLDPDGAYPVDGESDPPHGSFQILPTGHDTYQVIGANADLDRDTTIFPFDKSLWDYKHPISGKVNSEIFYNACKVQSGGLWNERCHRWIVSNDGKDMTPCIEVLWRPTMHQPAYPAEPGTTDADRWPSPPYTANFADTSATTDPWAPASVRWRDPLHVDDIVLWEGTVQAVIDDHNFSILGPTEPGYFDGFAFEVEGGYGNIVNYSGDPGFTVQVDEEMGWVADGDPFKIVKTRPRWSQSNIIIPRTGSDAWSPIPQGVWVRVTDDPPTDPEDPNYWLPDTSPADIAAIQDETHFPRGGPWGSAQWAMVMARFNPVGALWYWYEYSYGQANACSGHGDDEEEPHPGRKLTTIQSITTSGDGLTAPYAKTLALTDFDAVQCDCGCC